MSTPVKGFLSIAALFVFSLIIGASQSYAQEGEALFKNNCASCHHPSKIVIGPALKGAQGRWGEAGEAEMLYDWVKNSEVLAGSGKSARAKEMITFSATKMTPQAVSNEDIDAIFEYVESFVEKKITTTDPVPYQTIKKEGSNGWMLKLVLIGVLLIVVLAMAGVSRRLKEASSEVETDEDHTYLEIVKDWFWRNKVFAGVFILIVVFVGLSDLGWRAAQIDVMEGYQPSQPIKFSHIVHAGNHEIDCKYCHSSVEKSKHAGIPSVNVCMNCHLNINEGTYTDTTEISKIYDAVGYDLAKREYNVDEHGNRVENPIVWNKVHNLPDHVYFNHSQHVSVAGVDCIQCHGDVKTFDAGKVASVDEINKLDGTVKLTKPVLTMGWCIECHNEKEIDLGSNDYYMEIHERLKKDPALLKKYNKDEKITVRELGGWECAKCHY